MKILRDPIWQFVGVLLALLAIITGILFGLQQNSLIIVPPVILIGLAIVAIVVVAMPFVPLPAVRQGIERLVSITKRFFQSSAGKLTLLSVCFVAVEIVVLYIYADWRIVALSLAFLLLTVLYSRLLAKYPFSLRKEKPGKAQPKFSPIPLSGIGNGYFERLYIDPPFGDVILEGVEFQLRSQSLVFDTNGQLHFYTPRDNGSIEVNLNLSEPVRFVKSVHILINSSNSKDLYAGKKIGEIELVFKDSPRITTELILGGNIREWCLGAPGNLVRRKSDPLSKVVWQGVNKDGTYAVIDCLEIPVYEAIRKNDLITISFIHNPLQHDDDKLGVHYFVFAITAEIDT